MQLFEPGPLIFSAALAAVAFVLGVVLRSGHLGDRDSSRFVRGLEPGLLALTGSLLARALIVALLSGEPSDGTVVALGWAFGLVPGVIDTIPWIAGEPLPFGAAGLAWFAAVAGGLTGMMDGLWRTHRWKGLGVLSSLLDCTWGLSGSTTGCLLHLFNFAWAGHATGADEIRTGAHRYRSGFRILPDYAFTQGAVMSNMSSYTPSSSLWKHENTHVWQNRGFGPFFTLTYIAWMVLLLVPGLIAGIAKGRVGAGIEWWSYYNNPWEVWAYEANNPTSRDKSDALCWPLPAVLGLGILLFLGLVAAYIPVALAAL